MNGKTYVKFFKRIKKQTKSIYATTKKGKLRFLYQKTQQNTTKTPNCKTCNKTFF